MLKGATVNIDYRGEVVGLLDELASQLNLSWEFVNEPGATPKIHIFHVKTLVLPIDLLPGRSNFVNNLTSSSDAGGGEENGQSLNAGAAMTVSYENNSSDPWTDVLETVQGMLTSYGSVSANRTSGYITVTDLPSNLQLVENYVVHVNEKAGKKIAVRVDVYDVTTREGSNYGINWNAVANYLSSSVSLASNASSAITGLDGGGMFTFNTTNENSRFQLNNAMFSALQSIGDTSLVTGTTVYTVNGNPAPVQVVDRQDYVKEISFSSIGEGSSGEVQASVEPGTLVTGYFMVVTPKILSDNQILMNLSISLSNVVDIVPFEFPGMGSSDGQNSDGIFKWTYSTATCA